MSDSNVENGHAPAAATNKVSPTKEEDGLFSFGSFHRKDDEEMGGNNLALFEGRTRASLALISRDTQPPEPPKRARRAPTWE